MLFRSIGIGCSVRTREKIEAVRQLLVNQLSGIAWVPGENFHLTLAFLGTISTALTERLTGRLADNYEEESCFFYHLTELSRFPNAKGGVIALLGHPDKQLSGLYDRTLSLLHTVGLEPAWNTFKPHITLGRIRKPAKMSERISLPVDISLKIGAVTLYKSVLTPAGSVYSVLRKVPLGAPKN